VHEWRGRRKIKMSSDKKVYPRWLAENILRMNTDQPKDDAKLYLGTTDKYTEYDPCALIVPAIPFLSRMSGRL